MLEQWVIDKLNPHKEEKLIILARDCQINRDRNAAQGTRPRPSSIHEGGVNVIYCRGSGGFLSEKIDPHVYVKLLTCNGVTYGEGKLKPNSW